MFDHIQCRQVDDELSLEHARPPFRPRIVDFLKHWWFKRSASLLSAKTPTSSKTHISFQKTLNKSNILVFMHLTQCKLAFRVSSAGSLTYELGTNSTFTGVHQAT